MFDNRVRIQGNDSIIAHCYWKIIERSIQIQLIIIDSMYKCINFARTVAAI